MVSTINSKKRTVYYRFAQQILKALRIAHVRRFPHKHNPRKYGVWVHAVLLAFKQLEDKSYRFIAEMMAEMHDILALMGISQAPHWTTIHKAAQQFRGSLIEQLVSAFVRSTKSLKIRAGIDSTGLQLTRASAYYTAILKKDKKKRRKIRRHIKLSTVVDLDHQLPICFKIRRGPASDHWDSVPLLRKAYSIKAIRSLDADKGYTKEELRQVTVEEAGAEDRIKIKNPEVPIWRTKGKYLKKAKRRKLRANYRALCETYHSTLKRITGSMVRATTIRMQNKEVAFKVLACSALRRARIFLFKGLFYRANGSKSLKATFLFLSF